MVIRSIDPRRTAVMVIDMQNDFIAPGAVLFSQMGYDFVPAMADFLDRSRQKGMQIIYTQNVLRADGKDMGKSGDFCQAIKEGKALVEGTPGAEIYAPLAPKEGDIVLKKHRYSSFFGTDLDIILRTGGFDTVAITGVCTEACCFSTARDAGALGYDVAFLSDLTGTMDYPDLGFGPMTAQQMQNAMLTNIALTSAHVMTAQQLLELPVRG